MTREDLIARLAALRDDAAPVSTDTAAVLACLVRMLEAGADLSELTEACLDKEERARRREDGRGRRPGPKRASD